MRNTVGLCADVLRNAGLGEAGPHRGGESRFFDDPVEAQGH